jgi:uncharacterized membrane protein YeaQ/YmgE (transglycosylase-associated protein family)
MLHILGTILIGFVVGLLARFVTPGSNPGGFIVTVIIGIVGSFVAKFLGEAVGWYGPGQPAGFIGSVVGAVLILVVYHLVSGRSSTSTSS